MSERPILFAPPVVSAILSGAKTQTRRTVRGDDRTISAVFATQDDAHRPPSPFGLPGDRLWVRETWRPEERDDGFDGVRYAADDAFVLIDETPKAADAWVQVYKRDGRWRPSIHMPRWASRLTLEITDVRVERLQDISEADARAEGIPLDVWDAALVAPNYLTDGEFFQDWREDEPHFAKSERIAVESYRTLWDSLNAKRAPWSSNPWVWVLSFKRVESKIPATRRSAE